MITNTVHSQLSPTRIVRIHAHKVLVTRCAAGDTCAGILANNTNILEIIEKLTSHWKPNRGWTSEACRKGLNLEWDCIRCRFWLHQLQVLLRICLRIGIFHLQKQPSCVSMPTEYLKSRNGYSKRFIQGWNITEKILKCWHWMVQ